MTLRGSRGEKLSVPGSNPDITSVRCGPTTKTNRHQDIKVPHIEVLPSPSGDGNGDGSRDRDDGVSLLPCFSDSIGVPPSYIGSHGSIPDTGFEFTLPSSVRVS